MFEINHNEIPFSIAQSFLKIQGYSASESGRVQIATASKLPVTLINANHYSHDFYEIALFKDEQEVKYTAVAQPWQLDLHSDEGNAVFTFADANTFVFEAENLEICLIPCKGFAWKVARRNGDVVLFDYSGCCHHHARAAAGTSMQCYESTTSRGQKGNSDKPYTLSFKSNGKTQGALHFNRFGDKWEEFELDVGSAAAEVKSNFDAWMEKMPHVNDKYQETAEYA